jgi:hypothetical protein
MFLLRTSVSWLPAKEAISERSDNNGKQRSNFHLGSDSKYVMFCRKIFQCVTKGEDVPSFHNGSIIFLLYGTNIYILIEHGSRMIWTESLMFLANKVTVPHISFDSIHNITHGINL